VNTKTVDERCRDPYLKVKEKHGEYDAPHPSAALKWDCNSFVTPWVQLTSAR